PGVYDKGWQVYSHKNMDDFYHPKMDLKIELNIPPYLSAISPFNLEKIEPLGGTKTVFMNGEERLETEVYLTKNIIFEDFEIDSLHVLTNIDDEGISPVLKTLLIRRIVNFLQNNLGKYPHHKLLSTHQDYAHNPVYGLNQLPKFIRPFPEGFNYDLKQLKTISNNYLKNTLLLNPRKESWVYDAIETHLMMEYMKEYYPDLKVLGSLSDVIGIRWFHAADLKFNDKYSLLYMYMARKNLDQPLTTPLDSLIKFNRNIANPYKAGVGFKYLEEFLQDETVQHSIKEFYSENRLKPTSSEEFKLILEKNAGKDINWFFDDYISTNEKIDFKLRNLQIEGDSLEVTIRNRAGSGMPVQIYGLNRDEIVYKTWVEHVNHSKTVKIPAARVRTVALNYEGIVPEINQRNNYRRLGGIMNKPLQFRLLKDIEDPRYNQVFLMPEADYNLYDGLALGANFYNQTLLEKNFQFSFAPLYGLGSKTLVGSASLSHLIFFDNDALYAMRYGISGSRFSYGYNLMYQRFTPFLSLSFRKNYLRDSRKEYMMVRNINVYRDESAENALNVPDYSIFNINYSYLNPGLVEHYAGSVDFQLSKKFSKASITLEYRKLLQNDRQLNFRLFGGAFLYNDLPVSDYFSFALDRPSDYLFDYNYYGRSETSGLFSQQIILAEGGFKSMLEPQYANQWITTINNSTTIWKWVLAYADVGVVKNKNQSAKFLYDSGIRLSLIQNYFELFFPVYSNNGWEFGDGNYDQKIRFIATLDIRTLSGLFTREWF
ncbi:MAG: metalloprotease, partial [Salinimicrobium sp.]